MAEPSPHPSRLSPFDQIVAAERSDGQRFHEATAAFERERADTDDSLHASGEGAVERARTKAREELIQHKEQNLPRIMHEAQARAAEEVKRIEHDGKKHLKDATAIVVDAALSDSFPSLL